MIAVDSEVIAAIKTAAIVGISVVLTWIVAMTMLVLRKTRRKK